MRWAPPGVCVWKCVEVLGGGVGVGVGGEGVWVVNTSLN